MPIACPYSVDELERAAAQIGITAGALHDFVATPIRIKHGLELALAEALLHEAAHYLVAGKILVRYTWPKPRKNPSRAVLLRVTPRMLDAAVADRLEAVSEFVSDAEELDTAAVVQLTGYTLEFWNDAGKSPATHNTRGHLGSAEIQKQLSKRRQDRFIIGKAEDLAEWWTLVMKKVRA